MDDGDGTVETGETLDLRGLKCPLPVLRTRRALLGLRPGQMLVVRCTDPLAGLDIPNLLRETGDTLLDAAREGRETQFTIRKAPCEGAASPPSDQIGTARVDAQQKQ